MFDRISERLVSELLKRGVKLPTIESGVILTQKRVLRTELEESYGQVSDYEWNELNADPV